MQGTQGSNGARLKLYQQRSGVGLGFLTLALAFIVPLGAGASSPPLQSHRDSHAGSLASDVPQAVYAAEPEDAWNQIFYCLFTRIVRTRLSDEFPEGKPFQPMQVMGFPQLPVSSRSFERIEGGDQAIEPLSPSFFSSGPLRVLSEPRYSQLAKALEDALHEKTQRPPLARALMQSDVWAAYDLLARNYAFSGDRGKLLAERRNRTLLLLAHFIRQLALTPDEIQAFPDTYATAAREHPLPNLFGAGSEWLEVRWYEERAHDLAADFRRVARVFVKPASRPRDKSVFLNGLRNAANITSHLTAVALLTQDLLIDGNGTIVPTRLAYEFQMRKFLKDRNEKLVKTELRQYDLSRRLLLNAPYSGGLLRMDEQAPAYLPSAGNDYTFASEREAILVQLRTRCTACHGIRTAVVLSFAMHEVSPLPAVAQLNPSANEHARYVIRRKREREDFRGLLQLWKKG